MTDIIPDIPHLWGALLNGALVSGLIAGIAFASVRILDTLHPPTAATRYAIWTSAVVAMVVLPVVLWLAQPTGAPVVSTSANVSGEPVTQIAETTHSVFTPTNETAESTKLGDPATLAAPTASNAAADNAAANITVGRTDTRQAEGTSGFITVDVSDAPARVLSILLVLWAAIAALGLTRLMVGLIRMNALKRRAVAINPTLLPSPERMPKFRRRFRIAVTDEFDSPVACGLKNPAILVPAKLTSGLSAADLEPILLHEAAHLERFDDVTLLVQRLAECLMFFNPFVWVLTKRMYADREEACDAWVVAQTQRPEAYVRSVHRLIELNLLATRTSVVPGMADRTRRLIDRMKLVLETKAFAKPGVAAEQAAVVVAIVALVVCVTTVVRPLFSFQFEFDNAGDASELIRSVAVASNAGPIVEPVAPEPPRPVQGIAWETTRERAPEPSGEPATETGLAETGLAVAGPAVLDNAADLTPANWARLFQVAKGISSDGDRARILRIAALRIPDHRPTYEAYLDAAATIRSSGGARAALAELLRRDERANLPFVALIRATSRISSSGERAQLLRDLIREAPEGAEVEEALRTAVNGVSSSGERENLLRALARR